MNIRPMLAEDAELDKIKFSVEAQPKVDGVRSLHITGALTGRSLKKHKNLHVTERYAHSKYAGLDGEMFVGNQTDKALCRNTSSALGTIKGEPEVKWMLFDYITEHTKHLGYMERHRILSERIGEIGDSSLLLIPTFTVHSMADLLALETVWLDEGYEGVILRGPLNSYKSGRSTAREGGLLRIKRFIEEDAVVLAVIEGQSNSNEATTNELGRTERSSHQENMIPNGMVGALLCREVKTGMEITVSAGSMDHSERVKYFEVPELIVGKTIKFRHFPHGRKNLPRFPVFQCVRAQSDMA